MPDLYNVQQIGLIRPKYLRYYWHAILSNVPAEEFHAALIVPTLEKTVVLIRTTPNTHDFFLESHQHILIMSGNETALDL